jgi:Plasmid pRiA4b ORF-3-like protein
MPKTTGSADSIISLKVTLRGIRPPIWRRLLIPSHMTLADLHVAIQATIGWEDAHLHAFDIAGAAYGDPRSVDDVIAEKRLTLSALAKAAVTRFTYTYDFGDNWEHTIVLEETQNPEKDRLYPACVAGKRNCPPEDCGGAWRYQHLLAVRADPSHPQYAELSQWLDQDFDPEDFSTIGANAALAARFQSPKNRG